MYDSLSREELVQRLKTAEEIIKAIHSNRVDRSGTSFQYKWKLEVIATNCRRYMEKFYGKV